MKKTGSIFAVIAFVLLVSGCDFLVGAFSESENVDENSIIGDEYFVLSEDGLSYSLEAKEGSIGSGFNGIPVSGDVVIPSSFNGLPVTKIGKDAFSGSFHLLSIKIPESITVIEDNAFNFCQFLKKIEIPASVTHLGETVFGYCHSLESILVDENNSEYKSIEGVLYTRDGKSLIKYPGDKKNISFSVPFGVEKIEAHAFHSNMSLENVTLPDSLIEIKESGFDYCQNLNSVTFGNSLKIINKRAFSSCIDLLTVEIPTTVEVIGSYAFYWCKSLTTVTIPKSVITLGEEIFQSCWEIQDHGYIQVEIAEGQKPDWNEEKQTGWHDNWSISSSFSFHHEIKWKEENSNIIPEAYFALSNDKRSYSLEKRNSEKGIPVKGNVVIPASFKGLPVTTIGEKAFTMSEMNIIEIPSSITTIKAEAFSGCNSLTSIFIPETVKTLESKIFFECEKLENNLSVGIAEADKPVWSVETQTGWSDYWHIKTEEPDESWHQVNWNK